MGLGSTGAAGGRGDEDEEVEASEMIAQTSFDFAANRVSPAEGRKGVREGRRKAMRRGEDCHRQSDQIDGQADRPTM